MKKLILLCLSFFCCSSFGFHYPSAAIYLGSVPPTVFYGETLVVPVDLQYFALQGYKLWSVPPGGSLQSVSKHCPYVPYDDGQWGRVFVI
ncbi:hypothetical protein [Legionella fallonii]|uniref:Secreted protein n=1 Tax=Legionella fallonii LLAP-10 TaxID=1212491 RepID=A0A098G5J7_9GAMM|nr:hypothetical protein [Legionella fallonii]CEG56765.1 exported protein of unknown function [Legionella fallonii LLAP-10]